jgi:dTDP-4-amino-4,6-dideoxy-D-glucose ammonia-lyase
MNNNTLISWLNNDDEKFKSLEIDNLLKIDIQKNPGVQNDFIDNHLNNIKKIIKIFSKKPWVTQTEISKLLKIDREVLININSIISNSEIMQNLIVKEGIAKKYWNTIIPFASLTQKTLNNEYSFPRRIALFPGVSCMFYCGFCGRNQAAKYPLNILDESMQMYKKLFNDSSNNTAFSISGGLEPLTNPKLGEMVNQAYLKGIRMPIITNGYSLTENYLNKNEGLLNADSIRISLYGVDEKSYEFITRVKKSFKQVRSNTINFLNTRNMKNKKLKFGFNFIIIPENMDQLLEIPDLITDINSKVINGSGINFLTLRDDYQSVTSHSEKRDVERKYRLEKSMNIIEREKLKEFIYRFEEKRRKLCPDLHVDYGYSLESLFKGHLDTGLIKINGNQMRKYGFTQISVAVDLFGDVFLYREAGFLNREGNEKMIIGRISKNMPLEEVINNYLTKRKPLELESDDSRFMDSFDHVITSLVNQAEEDKKFKIPFELGPIKLRKENLKIELGNNWYSETT